MTATCLFVMLPNWSTILTAGVGEMATPAFMKAAGCADITTDAACDTPAASSTRGASGGGVTRTGGAGYRSNCLRRADGTKLARMGRSDGRVSLAAYCNAVMGRGAGADDARRMHVKTRMAMMPSIGTNSQAVTLWLPKRLGFSFGSGATLRSGSSG